MPPDVTPRLATAADNRACLELFSAVPMKGELELSTQREPDFFSLYSMQKAAPFTYVGDDGEGGLVGMATALIRDGWLDGAPAKVGYLGDLRVRFDRARTFGRFFGDFFDALCERTGCGSVLHVDSELEPGRLERAHPAKTQAAQRALVPPAPRLRRGVPSAHPEANAVFVTRGAQRARRRSPTAGRGARR